MSGQIRARAPGRVNLIGDHTDYTDGFALPIAIDRYVEIDAVESDRFHLVSDRFDAPAAFPIGTPPEQLDGWARYVAAVALELDVATGLAGTITSSLPIGGLSSSAALEVAVAQALGHSGTPADLAALCRRAEHRATGVPTGILDQLCIAVARSGAGVLIDCRALAHDHVEIPDDLGIVVLPVSVRTLTDSGYDERFAECKRAEERIGSLRDADGDAVAGLDDPLLRRRARHVTTENRRVTEFAAALRSGDRPAIGALMIESHHSLRDDFDCSTPEIDRVVASLIERPGVFGARMTGGGFGGCVVAACEPDAEVPGLRVRPVGAAAVARS